MVQIVFMLFVACGGPLSILEAIVTKISVWLFTITILLLWRRWCVRIITLVIILFSVATEEIKVSSPKKYGDMVIIYSKAYGGSGGGRDETDLAWKGRHIYREVMGGQIAKIFTLQNTWRNVLGPQTWWQQGNRQCSLDCRRCLECFYRSLFQSIAI